MQGKKERGGRGWGWSSKGVEVGGIERLGKGSGANGGWVGW